LAVVTQPQLVEQATPRGLPAPGALVSDGYLLERGRTSTLRQRSTKDP